MIKDRRQKVDGLSNLVRVAGHELWLFLLSRPKVCYFFVNHLFFQTLFSGLSLSFPRGIDMVRET